MDRASAARSLSQFAHITKISAALPYGLAIKGPVLSYVLYGDVARRNSIDIDFLVPREHLADAMQRVRSLGFETDLNVPLQTHLRREHDVALAHADGTLLELHVDVAQPHYSYNLDLAPWFERAVGVSINGLNVRTLALDDAALFAVIHATKHAWSTPDLLDDLCAFDRVGVNWGNVQRQAQMCGAQRALEVAAVLMKVNGCAQIGVPTSTTAARIADGVGHRWAQDRLPKYWEARRFDLGVRERFGDRFRYVRRLFFKLPA